ncbi:pentapeptide repeat-containing protein [Endozoicomonas gorgoniicola]
MTVAIHGSRRQRSIFRNSNFRNSNFCNSDFRNSDQTGG